MNKKVIIILFILLGLAASVLAVLKFVIKKGTEKDVLVVYNWDDYIDPDMIREFEDESGVKVVLKEYSTVDEAVLSIEEKTSDYDLVISNQTVMGMLKAKNLIEKIDVTKISNKDDLMDRFKTPDYDPNHEYTIPYLWGSTGLLINTKFVGANVNSWDVLWDEKFKDKILLIDDAREVTGAIQKHLGMSFNSRNKNDIEKVRKFATKLLKNKATINYEYEFGSKLIQGDAYVAMVYNGDAVYEEESQGELKFILPKEGYHLWVDSMMVVKGSDKREAAYEFINYMLNPEVSAKNVEYTYFASPVKGAEEYINDQILKNSKIYPDEEVLKRGEFQIYLGEEVEKKYRRIYDVFQDN